MIDFFPRLNPGLRVTLTRNNRKGADLHQLLRNAQEVWGTFTNKQQSRKRTLPSDNSISKRNQRQSSGAQAQQSNSLQYNQSNPGSRQPTNTFRNTISNEERQRRIGNELCFKCGKPNHLAKDRPENPTPKPQSQSEPSKSQSAANQSIRQNKWRETARFQTVTTQDKEDQSDSQDEEFTDIA